MRKKIKNPNMIQRVVLNFCPAAAGIDHEQAQHLAFNLLGPIVKHSNRKGLTKTKTRFPLFATQLQRDDGNLILAFKTRWNEKTNDGLAIANLNEEANQQKGISPFLFFLTYGEALYDEDWSDIPWIDLHNTPWLIFKRFITAFTQEYFRLIAIYDRTDNFLAEELMIQGDTTWVPFLSPAAEQTERTADKTFNELEEQLNYFSDNPVYVKQ